jgi:chitinase
VYYTINTASGNACWGYYDLPNGADGTGYVLKNCAGVGDAIKLCQKNGKKVLLSLGGGAAPADYYLPSKKVAEYFGDWLWSAFGPATAAWTNADKPRPFGDAVIDGFDLDIESGSRWDYYSDFVNHLKAKKQSMIFSAAPQCISPDPRLAEAIKNAPFDFIFTQFYNTPECSARQGLTDLGKAKTGFSFDTWATWLQANSKNPDVKLYIGLAAGVQGAGAAHADHYLAPTEAFRLITQYQGHAKFGGVMLWEWTVSVNNQRFGRAYLDWIKYSLNGTFKQMYKPMVSSSSVRTSTTISSTSTQLTSTLTTKTSSVTPSSSATPSKSATPSSSAAVSTLTPTKSATSASSVMTTLTPTETVIASSTASSTSVVETYSESVIYSESFSVVYPSTVISASEISSVYPSETPSTSDVLSSVLATETSTDITSTVSATEISSVYPTEVSSVYPTETPTSDVLSSVLATEIPSTSEIVSTVSATEVSSVSPSETPLTSDVLSSVLATEVSSVYPTEIPSTSEIVSTVSATEVSSVSPSETPLTSDIISTVSATEVSSVYPSEIPTDVVSTVSATEISSVYPSETPSASEILSTVYPSEIPSASDILSTVYPSETASEYSSSALPTEASAVYPSQNSTAVPYPTQNATNTASGYYGYPTGTGSPSIVYPVDVSTVYPEDVSTVYPSNTEVYDSFVLFSSTKTNGAHATASVSCTTSSSATHAPVYPTASSSVGVPEASTKKPEYPADATTTVVTSKSSATFILFVKSTNPSQPPTSTSAPRA